MGVLYSKKNGVWLRVSGGKKEPYNDALALVGIGKAGSLEAVLSNSEYCTALAGNAEAYTIMKDNYSADMTTAVDSAWNDGLNTLNYRCKLKCYLFHDGNECSSITGGFNYNGAYNSDGYIDLRIPSGSEHSYARTKNKLDTTGYTKLSTVIDVVGSNVKCGLTSSSSWNENYDGVGSGEVKTPQTKTLDITNKSGYYYKCNSWGSQGKVSKVYITP